MNEYPEDATKSGPVGPRVLVKLLKTIVVHGSGVPWPAGATASLAERDAVDAAVAGDVEILPGELSPSGAAYLASGGATPYAIRGPRRTGGATVLVVADRDGVMLANRVMSKGEVVEVPETVAYAIFKSRAGRVPGLSLASGFTLGTAALEAAASDPKFDTFNVF